jgi:hypothetical protein
MSAGRFFSIFVLTFFAGCGGGNDSGDLGREGACNTLGLKIVGGEGCRASGSPIAAILVDRGGGVLQLCSGSLITSSQLLSAAHCFSGTVVEAAAAIGTGVFPIESWVIHPDFQRGGEFAPFDLAVVKLSGTVDVDTIPIIASRNVGVGELITAFGYGSDEKGRTALDEEREETLKAGNMIVSDSLSGVFLAAFNSTGSAVCSGDSGGPAIQVVDGSPGIVGVTSFDIAGCGRNSRSGFVSIPINLPFLQTAAPTAQFR